MDEKKFIFFSIGLTCFFVVLVSIVIYIVDPYSLFGNKKTNTLNMIKLEIPNEDQANSVIASAFFRKPEVIILGSSRVRRGINQEKASELMQSPVMVAGLDSLNTSQAKELMIKLVKIKSIKSIIVEINFFTSNQCKQVSNFRFHHDDSFIKILSFKKIFLQTLRTIKSNLLSPSIGEGYFDQSLNYHTYQFSKVDKKQMELESNSIDNLFNFLSKNCIHDIHDENELIDMINLTNDNQVNISFITLPSSEKWRERMHKSNLQQYSLNWTNKISNDLRLMNIPYYDMEFLESKETAYEKNIPLFWDELHFSNVLGGEILESLK